MNYLYIVGTLIFTVIPQIVLKWRLREMGSLPSNFSDKLFFLFKAITDPYIFCCFVSGFAASLCWMAVLTKFELTKAYPFMSLAPPLVFLISIFVLGESFTPGKVIGLVFVVLGIIITVKA